MKIRIEVLIITLTVCLTPLAALCQGTADVHQRVGVFDSRAIAIACNSPAVANAFAKLGERMKIAKEKGDTTAIKAIEREAQLRQAMLHEQGFGKGSVISMIALVKDSVAALAAREKVILVVSKYEVVCSAKDVELVDLTEKITEFFHPNEQVKAWLKDLPNKEPIEEAYLAQD